MRFGEDLTYPQPYIDYPLFKSRTFARRSAGPRIQQLVL